MPNFEVTQAAGRAASPELLLGVAEHLKIPLINVARGVELMPTQEASGVQAAAEAALRLIDNYIFGLKACQGGGTELIMEPVSIPAVLYDAGHALDAYAEAYGVSLELRVEGKFGPVMSNRQGMQVALESLGSSLIEALPASGARQLKLQLATHRSRYGLVAGLYANPDAGQFTAAGLRRGYRLQGHARQPLPGLSHTAAAGVFVADTILKAIGSGVKASQHQNLRGLGAIFTPSRQLQMV